MLKLLDSTEPFYDVLKSRSGAILSDWSDKDKIAHGGKLSLRPLNITINPIGESKVLSVARSNKTNVDKDWYNSPSLTSFMESTMNQLFALIESVYKVILKEELPPDGRQ